MKRSPGSKHGKTSVLLPHVLFIIFFYLVMAGEGGGGREGNYSSIFLVGVYG